MRVSYTRVSGVPYNILDELYDGWVESVVDDVPFYLELADELAGVRGVDTLDILELGAGSGRITLPLADEGHRVTAVDASPRQLARLAATAPDSVTLVEADIVNLPVEDLATYDLVIVPFRTLLHVAPDAVAVFDAAKLCLVEDGDIAFDVFHPTDEVIRDTNGRWIPRTSINSEHGPWRISERATYDERLVNGEARDNIESYRMKVEVRCERVGDAPESRLATLELYVPPPQWWRECLEIAGFTLDSVYGWFNQRPFEPDDDDSVWVAHVGD